MKKILISILIIVFGLSISACNKDNDIVNDELIKDKTEVLDFIYSRKMDVFSTHYDTTPDDLYDIYRANKDVNRYYIGEMKIVEKKLIAGYIDKKSEYKVTRMYANLFSKSPSYVNNVINGRSTLYEMASRLYFSNVFDLTDFDTYLYECNNNIPLVREDKIFAFVIEYYRVDFYKGNYITYVRNIKGEQKDDTYVLDGNRSSLVVGKYLKRYDCDYYPVRLLSNEDSFIEIENYKGVEAIKFSSSYYVMGPNDYYQDYLDFPNFFELIKDSILSEEKELKDNTTYYVAYDKVKDLFFTD